MISALFACEDKRQASLTSRAGPQVSEDVLALIQPYEKPANFEGQSAHVGFQADQFIVRFSEKGRGVVYAAKNEKGSYLVHNGRSHRPYDAIGDFVVSPNGTSVAYGARTGKRWTVLVDGKEGKWFDEVGIPVFSPDGRHIAFEARKGNRWVIVLDYKESKACESYYEKPIFSYDSKRLLRIENTMDGMIKRFIISDLDFSDEKTLELRGRLFVSAPDKRRFAFVEELKEGKRLVEFDIDNPQGLKRGDFYDEISYISFGDDRVSIAYAAAKGKERYLILNGRKAVLPEGDLLSLPVIRPDGRVVGIFIGKEKEMSLYQFFYGDRIEIKKGKAHESASDLVYSGDSSQFAYLIREGKGIYAVIGGRKVGRYDMIVTPVFSPDGRCLLYRARDKGKRFVEVRSTKTGRLVKRGPFYERVFELHFSEDGKRFFYGALERNRLLLVTDSLE